MSKEVLRPVKRYIEIGQFDPGACAVLVLFALCVGWEYEGRGLLVRVCRDRAVRPRSVDLSYLIELSMGMGKGHESSSCDGPLL